MPITLTLWNKTVTIDDDIIELAIRNAVTTAVAAKSSTDSMSVYERLDDEASDMIELVQGDKDLNTLALAWIEAGYRECGWYGTWPDVQRGSSDDIEDAIYVSVWDGGVEVRTSCKWNNADEVAFDVEPANVHNLESLEREYVLFADGDEIDVDPNAATEEQQARGEIPAV
jgi:hypothetical protein